MIVAILGLPSSIRVRLHKAFEKEFKSPTLAPFRSPRQSEQKYIAESKLELCKFVNKQLSDRLMPDWKMTVNGARDRVGLIVADPKLMKEAKAAFCPELPIVCFPDDPGSYRFPVDDYDLHWNLAQRSYEFLSEYLAAMGAYVRVTSDGDFCLPLQAFKDEKLKEDLVKLSLVPVPADEKSFVDMKADAVRDETVRQASEIQREFRNRLWRSGRIRKHGDGRNFYRAFTNEDGIEFRTPGRDLHGGTAEDEDRDHIEPDMIKDLINRGHDITCRITFVYRFGRRFVAGYHFDVCKKTWNEKFNLKFADCHGKVQDFRNITHVNIYPGGGVRSDA